MTPRRTTSRPKAYSYVRFSSAEQEKGDSVRRQTEAAERYAALHSLDLDDKLTFRDLGVSAYRGSNAEVGHLGEFMTFVRSGDVPQGSYLLVESLDRISRDKARIALRTLEDICDAGITVVTLVDGKTYTAEIINNDPMALMWALMVTMRAHEESATKAKRVREAWGAKRRAAKERPLTRRCPGWLRLRDDRSGFELISERAAIVRRIFDMTLAGRGQHSIAATLNREGVPVFGRGKHWQRSYVKKMLADPSTIGIFTPHRIDWIAGKKARTPTDPVEGYFPAAVDREAFERVRALTNGRATGGKEGASTANILAGLAKCPLCEATMTRVNKGRGKKGGRPYLVCTKAKAGAGCRYRQVRLDYIHKALVDGAGEMVAHMPSPDEDIHTEWQRIDGVIWGITEGIDRLVEAVEASGQSRALLDRLAEAERELEEARRRQGEIEDRLAATLTNRTQDIAYTGLMDAVEAQDVAAINVALRQLFERIVVDYPRGELVFHWKHAPGSASELLYAWPEDE